MNGRKAIVGLCMACALLVSAVGAQSAAAAQTGTTAFTCSESATTKSWSNAHCNGSVATKTWGHVKIEPNVQTELVGGPGTSKPVQRLKATINGIATELTTESLTASGTMENKASGEEMWSEGSYTVTMTAVTVTKPAGASCVVSTDNGGKAGEAGVLHSAELTATTKGQGDSVKLTPKSGSLFATYIMSGCKGTAALEGLNGTYTVNGSILGQPNGGETVFTHATTTEPETLLINGSIKAGADGSSTPQARANSTESYKALASTTPPYSE